MSVSGTVTIKLFAQLSLSHLLAAAQFCRAARVLEQEWVSGAAFEPICHEHRANVLAAVVLATNALDAAVTEFWELNTPHLEPPSRGRTGEPEILTKCQALLVNHNAPTFDEHAQPYESARILIQLRNRLVHYKPKWHSQGDPRTSLEQSLCERFELHPIFNATNPVIPDRVLGYGCAAWSVKTAVALLDELYNRLVVPAPHEGYRSRLNVV